MPIECIKVKRLYPPGARGVGGRGTAVAQWLMWCAINRKVAGSVYNVLAFLN